jgi:hypothetical protein
MFGREIAGTVAFARVTSNGTVVCQRGFSDVSRPSTGVYEFLFDAGYGEPDANELDVQATLAYEGTGRSAPAIEFITNGIRVRALTVGNAAVDNGLSVRVERVTNHEP